MKKILKKSAAALAVLTLTAALAGCGSSASFAAASTDTAASTAETSGENELEKVKAAGKLVGDVDFDAAEPIVDAITPVPGGVGTVTTAILAKHVIEAAERASK